MNGKKIKTVCTVTNFRNASTSFTLLKSEEYDLPWKSEMFSHALPHFLGKVEQGQKALNKFTKNEIDLMLLDEIVKGTKCCFKLMPLHIRNEKTRRNVVKSVDKLYYLYRRNFIDQVKSLAAVRLLGGIFTQTGFEVKSSDFYERAKETHLGRSGIGKTSVQVVTQKHLDKWPNMPISFFRDIIVNNYIEMSKLYKEFPGELICYEDYFKGEKYLRYNKQVHWEIEPIIEDFDVESLFK